MWILQFLPNWIFYAILIGGIFGLLLNRYVPQIYRLYVQIGSAVAFVVGTFMSGAIHDNEAWLARVREMEAKVAKAEEQAKEATTQIDSKVDKQTVKIKEKQVVVKEYITREVAKYDNQCVIPKEFIEAHNKAAQK
jgi:hypothetical protein